MSDELRVLFAAGGTGGHIYPAIAVACRLLERHPGARVLFAGSKERMEGRVVPQAGFELSTISSGALGGRTGWTKRALSVCRIALGLAQSFRLVSRLRPQVAIGTGGYVCAPVLLACRLTRVPVVLLDQNELPGLATRWLARIAAAVGVVSPEAASRLPSGAPARAIGSPVRPEVLTATREQAARALELDAGRPALVVIGGSIGSAPINRALMGALQLLAGESWFRPVQVLHLTGGWQVPPAPDGIDYRALPYLDRMEYALAAADLVVSRAGGSSLAEITARGLPAILVPWPGAAQDHQAFNAEPLARAAAAVVIPQQELSAKRLAGEIARLMADPAGLAEMSRRSRALGRPEAADRVVDLIEELAERKRYGGMGV